MKQLIFASVIALILCGCATTSNSPAFLVKIDSSQPSHNSEYVSSIIVPSEEGLAVNDPAFIEYSEYVESALRTKGISRIYNFDQADMVVFLSYGIGNPQTVSHDYVVPVWGDVIHSYSTPSLDSRYDTAAFSGSTSNVYETRIVGYRRGSKNQVEYSRRITLTAFDLKEFRNSKKEIMLWDTTITSAGSSGDLRRVFPAMIAAAVKHIGTDTSGSVIVRLQEDDHRIVAIKGTPPPESSPDFMYE